MRLRACSLRQDGVFDCLTANPPATMRLSLLFILITVTAAVTGGGLKCARHYYFDGRSETCRLCSRGPCPVDRFETIACNATHDRVCSLLPTLASRDCVMGDYGSYLPCNASCSPGQTTATGTRLRIRNVRIAQRGEGAPCPPLIDTRSCQIACERDLCDGARSDLFGQNCSSELNLCAHISCNSGACANEAQCLCRPGFVGEQCQCNTTHCNPTAVVNCSSTGAVSCEACLIGKNASACCLLHALRLLIALFGCLRQHCPQRCFASGYTGQACNALCNSSGCLGDVLCLQADANVRSCAACQDGLTGRACTLPCPRVANCVAGTQVCNQASPIEEC